ncbi:MAG: hypothetical protein FJ149_11515 [Euryarchaeota archaeon]|nr:hypothetical protein [Euryarchaeota archaeon]
MSGFKRLARKGAGPPGNEARPRHGWGVAYFPAGSPRVVREFGDAGNSVRYDEVSHMASSNSDARVLLAQLWASPSRELLADKERVAPLAGPDGSGRRWFFAFDGEVGKHRRTGEPFAADPVREMCSERLFRELLSELRGAPSDRKAVASAVGAVLRRTAEGYDFTHMTLAMSEGSGVYMARWAQEDAGWNRAAICCLPRAIVGCSDELPGVEGKWEPLGNRRLVFFDRSQALESYDL